MRYVTLVLYLTLSLTAAQAYLSPADVAVSEDGAFLYLACDDRIQRFDIANEKVSAEFKVANVRELALSADERHIYVACGEFNGRLVEIDAKNGKVKRCFSLTGAPNWRKAVQLLSPQILLRSASRPYLRRLSFITN